MFHRSLADYFEFRRELKLSDEQNAQLNDRISVLSKSMSDLSTELNKRICNIENKLGMSR